MPERNPSSGRKRRASASAGKAAEGESKAQAEFARYKQRVESAAGATGFGTPLPRGAMPVWSLQPPGAATAPPGAWPPPPAVGTPSIVQGFGTTIRLGVDFLNAALASGAVALGGVGGTVRSLAWGEECGCDDCCGCGAVDCCSVVGCGCESCCEPSVGTCC